MQASNVVSLTPAYRHKAYVQEAVQQAHGDRQSAEVELEVEAGLQSKEASLRQTFGALQAAYTTKNARRQYDVSGPAQAGCQQADEAPASCISTCYNTDTSAPRSTGRAAASPHAAIAQWRSGVWRRSRAGAEGSRW